MNALVTGGGGFLGKALVKQLLDSGMGVTILSRSRYPSIEAMGAKGIQADLSNTSDLGEHLTGIDIIFHTAAKAGVWGKKEDFWSINVAGTERLLQAAQKKGIQYFIYTSSPSAVWHGGDEINLKEEDCPYPEQYLGHYPHSKAVAEKMVLDANRPNFRTTSLRPHLIWGPEDPHFIPRLLERAHRLRIVGNGQNKVGICYVENAAYAHILAAKELQAEAKNSGKAYFITDKEPILIWEWLNSVLTSLGKPPIRKRISLSLAEKVGGFLEWVWRTFSVKGEPMMTRFVARQLAHSHYYDLSAAIADFGYTEHTSPEEGFENMIRYFSEKYVP
ncbi:MAG: NAD-dependent epimerase/dehydratase family protein [Myxococcota bacterium]|nr:NAD-dependent epimerase/dehydratase family protein [Myxococcota bacterium]